jgi:hypothetical protein
LVWFVVAFTGNGNNLAIGRRLSKSFCPHRENKFQFFSLQASNPYNHKGFQQFNARKTIGKNFAAILKSGNQSTRKAKGKERTWYVQVPKQRRKGLEERTKERKEGRKGWKERFKNLLPHSNKYPQQADHSIRLPGALLAGIAHQVLC